MRQDLNAKKVLRTAGIILLFVVIFGYGIWISRDLLFGIQNSVTGISDGLSVTDSILTLSGRARHANDVTLDGRIVSIDQKGAWTDTIALLPGYNVVTVGATDKFGRTKSQSYRVYSKAALSDTPASPEDTATSTPETATSTSKTASSTPTPSTGSGQATASSTDAVQ